MKSKFTLLMIVLFISVINKYAGAQIPNNGFENWNDVGNCEEPANWYSANLFDTTGSFCPITKSTDHYPASAGNYSLQIENNPSLLPNFNGYGIISTTQLDGSDRPLFPITGHPTSLCGYYKFNSVNNDTMSINIYLYYNSVEVANAHLINNLTVANWTSFSIPITSYTNADSARITLMSCNIEGGGAQGNSELYVDNLSFDSLIVAGIPEPCESVDFTIYPNPSHKTVEIVIGNIEVNLNYLQVINALGQPMNMGIFSYPNGTIVLDISRLSHGIYLLRMRTNKGLIITRKIIIAN